MKYKDLKHLLSLFANTEDILKSDWIDATRILFELKQLNKAYEDDKYIYFSSVAANDRVVTRAKDGKTFFFAKNILLSHTDLLSKVNANEVVEYQGRAKTLWKCPKMVYMEFMKYFNKYLYSKGVDIWQN